MAAISSIIAGIGTAIAGVSAAKQIEGQQAQKKFMGDEAMKQEENLQKEQAAQKENQAQNAAAKDLANKKARQDALAAGKAGRQGTILTGSGVEGGASAPVAGGLGEVPAGGTAGTKTLLGA